MEKKLLRGKDTMWAVPLSTLIKPGQRDNVEAWHCQDLRRDERRQRRGCNQCRVSTAHTQIHKGPLNGSRLHPNRIIQNLQKWKRLSNKLGSFGCKTLWHLTFLVSSPLDDCHGFTICFKLFEPRPDPLLNPFPHVRWKHTTTLSLATCKKHHIYSLTPI